MFSWKGIAIIKSMLPKGNFNSLYSLTIVPTVFFLKYGWEQDYYYSLQQIMVSHY